MAALACRSMGTDSADLAQRVAVELERLARKARPMDVRNVETPELERIASSAGLSIGDLIAQGVESTEPKAYRDAAHSLLVDDAVRSKTFTTRSKLAAAAFDVTYDGFRRVSKGRPSIREMVFIELAQSITREALTVKEAVSSGVESHPAALSLQGNRWRRRSLVAIAVLVITAGVGAWWLAALAAGGPEAGAGETGGAPAVADDGEARLFGDIDVSRYCAETYGSGSIAQADPESDNGGWRCSSPGQVIAADLAEACRSQYGNSAHAEAVEGGAGGWRCVTEIGGATAGACLVDAGAFDPSLTDEFSAYAARFRTRFEAGGGVEALGCPLTLMHHWADGIMQEFGDGEVPTTAILALSPEQVVLLDGASWSAFRRIKGLTGGLVGYPTTEPQLVDEMVVVSLSAGGELMSKSSDGPFYWLAPVVAAYWRQSGGVSGCLGAPISDAYTDLGLFKQDFEQGQLTLNPFAGELTAEPACV